MSNNKIRITIAEHAGFCFGVKRAIEQIDKLKNRLNNKKTAYVLGKLIHNPQVIEELRKKGISSVENQDKIKEGSTVIISAHGIPDKTINNLKKQNFEVIDCTCPLVKKVHEITKEAEREGYITIIFGDKKHIEVKGIKGNLKNSIIISDVNEVNKLDKGKKYCLVSQTTQNVEKFNKLADKLKKSVKNLKVYDTICIPTKQRQSSSIELAKKSDLMLVIGGKISANTKRLAQRCSEFTETCHIETEKELKKEWFKGKKNIGVTAGASTPQETINKIINKIKKWNLKIH